MNKVSDTLVNPTTDSLPVTKRNINTPFHLAIKDFMNGLKKWEIWTYYAYADIKRRYRRTVIGPFWTTLSLAIFITCMGVLFSVLWHRDIKEYLVFFASGYLVWICFSTTVNESCSTFIKMEDYLKQIALPYSIYAYIVVTRNLMTFLHQFVVFIALALLFHVNVNMNTLLVIPGFILLIANLSWISISLGMLCARYRDLEQIVISILQISMFVTPIFWPESQLGSKKLAFLTTALNPIYHFISVIRYPLLGQNAHLISWIVDISICFVGFWLTSIFLGRNYNKLIYWL